MQNVTEGFTFVIPSFRIGDTIIGPPGWADGEVVAIFTTDKHDRTTVEYIIQPSLGVGKRPSYKFIQVFTSEAMEV